MVNISIALENRLKHLLFIIEPLCMYISYRFKMSACLGVIDENDAKFE